MLFGGGRNDKDSSFPVKINFFQGLGKFHRSSVKAAGAIQVFQGLNLRVRLTKVA